MQKWKINIKSAAKIGLDWRRNKQLEHHSDYLRNISNLIKRHNPLNRIAHTNGFCNSRLIWERNAGKKRIANRTSAPANKATLLRLVNFEKQLPYLRTVKLGWFLHVGLVVRLRCFFQDISCCANTITMPAIMMHMMPARLTRSGVISQNIQPKIPTDKR